MQLARQTVREGLFLLGGRVRRSQRLWAGWLGGAVAMAALLGVTRPSVGQPTCVDDLVEFARILGTTGDANDQFGYAVAIDGDLMVVGAYLQDTNGILDSGAAYVFRRGLNGEEWGIEATLVASDPFLGDNFGQAVDVSGSTIVIGAPQEGDSGGIPIFTHLGAAYVFTLENGVWTPQQKLRASDAADGDMLGWSVAIAGNTIVAGAPGDSVANGTDQGSAYVFNRSGTTWTQTTKLLAPDRATDDQFGISVDIASAVTRNTIVVGCSSHDLAGGANQGAAYVFTIDNVFGGPWTHQATLIASDAATNNYFGYDVAISGESIISGAYGNDALRGAAYVFRRTLNSWSEEARLTDPSGTPGDEFGAFVAIVGDVAAIGAHRDLGGAGKAVTFQNQNGWQADEEYFGEPGDQFGSVAIGADHICVGANAADTHDALNAGEVVVFDLGFGPGQYPDAVVNRPTDQADNFGACVATTTTASGRSFLFVGAPTDDGTNGNVGSAYAYHRLGQSWLALQKVALGQAGDEFGTSIAAHEFKLVIGAPGADTIQGADTGRVYVFSVSLGILPGVFHAQTIDAPPGSGGGRFGSSVALYNDALLVGAPLANGGRGQAHFYGLPTGGSEWQHVETRTGDNPGDHFGTAVALTQATVAGVNALRARVGAPGSDAAGIDAGAVWAYTLNPAAGSSWSFNRILRSDGLSAGAAFGTSISMDPTGGVVVGAPLQGGPGGNEQGAIYHYDGADAALVPNLLRCSTGAALDHFGYSVSIAGPVIAVGMPLHELSTRPNSGGFITFVRHDTAWDEGPVQHASDRGANDSFGWSVALSENWLAVGGPYNDTPFVENGGAAYTYMINVSTAPSMAAQPQDVYKCSLSRSGATFTTSSLGTPPLTYQWQRVRDAEVEDIPGATSASYFLPSATPEARSWGYRVVVSNGCGSVASTPAFVTTCPADLAENDNAASCDSGVTIDDLVTYVTQFQLGSTRADLDDNGVDPQLPDGGVTIDDLIFFLFHYEAGC